MEKRRRKKKVGIHRTTATRESGRELNVFFSMKKIDFFLEREMKRSPDLMGWKG